MNMKSFYAPSELGHKIAANARAIRKKRKISQKRLSEMAGVSFGSIKRFEASGEISLKSLLKIAIVLDCAEVFAELFAQAPLSIQEIIDGKL